MTDLERVKNFLKNPKYTHLDNVDNELYKHMPNDIKISNQNNFLVFENNNSNNNPRDEDEDIHNKSKNIERICSIRVDEHNIFFTYSNPDIKELLPYTWLNMYSLNTEGQIEYEITTDDIDKIQEVFRLQNTSLSNVFIIGKNNLNNTSFRCIFYPVRLDVLDNKNISPNDIKSSLSENFVKNYSNSF